MTGDDHGAAARTAELRPLRQHEPAGLLGGELGVRARHVLHLHRHPDDGRASRGLSGPGLRDRAAPLDGLRELHARSCERLDAPAREWRAKYPSLAAPRDEPHPLHRLERLGRRSRRSSARRHPARHQLLLLARQLGRRTGPAVHRLGLPDALRRHRRHADRRLSGGDADDRRDGRELSRRTSTRSSTTRSGRRATTASSRPTCTPTRPSIMLGPTRSSPRQPAACRWSRPEQMLDWLDGATAPRSRTWS